MDWTSECPLCLWIIYWGQFEIELSEFAPFIFASYVNEGREVVGRIVTNILVVRLDGCVDEEVCNANIYLSNIFECGDKGTNVLEGCASYDLGRGVKQESIVECLQFCCLLVQWTDLCNLSYDVCTRLSHTPFFVLCELFVQWENSIGEAVEWDILGHVV